MTARRQLDTSPDALAARARRRALNAGLNKRQANVWADTVRRLNAPDAAPVPVNVEDWGMTPEPAQAA